MISNLGLNGLKLYHGVPQTLKYRNGFRAPSASIRNSGDEPLDKDSVAFVSEGNGALYDPILTYGRVQRPKIEAFRPDYVIFDRVVLKFSGYFKQLVPGLYNSETIRTRYVNIMYFMEDDTMTVMEPTVMNSGYPQGRIVRRARILKNQSRNIHYTWKDLNIGIDLEIFGIKYHLTDCDKFTREFLTSQGIEVNDGEKLPFQRPKTTPITSIKPHGLRPLTGHHHQKRSSNRNFDRILLTFDCILVELKKLPEDSLTFKMYYFLEDDTIAVKELKENQEGRDYFPMLFKRSRPPKNSTSTSVNATLLASDEVENDGNNAMEFYEPLDLMIGEMIKIYGHCFLLIDCDLLTRKYYRDVLKKPQKEKLCIRSVRLSKRPPELPDYLGFGTPEDSMASCFKLVPKAPRKDIVNYLKYANKYLRFGCILDSVHPEDKNRKFIFKYSLADGRISIAELHVPNSGIDGGKFLSPQLVVRPGSNPKLPEYYTAKDFYVGAILTINFQRFKLHSADLAVYHYMKENPELFSREAIESVRNYLKIEDVAVHQTPSSKNIRSLANDTTNADFHLNDSMKNLEIADVERNFMNRDCSINDIPVKNENCNEKMVRFDMDSCNDNHQSSEVN